MDAVELEKRKQEEFYEQAERFRNSDKPNDVKRLGDQLGRLIFGDPLA